MTPAAVHLSLSAMGVSVVSSAPGRIRLVCELGSVPAAAVELARERKAELVAILDRSTDLPPCSQCGGVQYAIPTFDGYENFECIPCDKCSGCQEVAK